jgi:hypothetical protein
MLLVADPWAVFGFQTSCRGCSSDSGDIRPALGWKSHQWTVHRGSYSFQAIHPWKWGPPTGYMGMEPGLATVIARTNAASEQRLHSKRPRWPKVATYSARTPRAICACYVYCSSDGQSLAWVRLNDFAWYLWIIGLLCSIGDFLQEGVGMLTLLADKNHLVPAIRALSHIAPLFFNNCDCIVDDKPWAFFASPHFFSTFLVDSWISLRLSLVLMGLERATSLGNSLAPSLSSSASCLL